MFAVQRHMWHYRCMNNEIQNVFLLLYLIDLVYISPYVHLYAMLLETKSILHCLMLVMSLRHYVGKIYERYLATQRR